MKKRFIQLIAFLAFFIFASNAAYAQCTSATINTLTATATNSCGNDGTITVNYTTTDAKALLYLYDSTGKEINSVIGASGTNSFTWSATGTPATQIHGGTYTVKIICGTDQSIIYATKTVSVSSSYTPMKITPSATNQCTNYAAGGTLNLSGNGGAAPFSIKVTAPDNTTTTVAAATLPVAINVTQNGTYKYTVTDACNNTFSDTYAFNPSKIPMAIYWRSSSNCDGTVTASAWFALNNKTGAGVSSNMSSVKIVVHTGSITGPAFYTGVYDGTQFVPALTYTPSADHKYYIEATSPCGEKFTYQHNLTASSTQAEFASFLVSSSTSGCPGSETECLNLTTGAFWKYPITIKLTGADGIVTTKTSNDWTPKICGLKVQGYTVEITDSCTPTNYAKQTVADPKANLTNTVSATQNLWMCDAGTLQQTGTTIAQLYITGYLPNRSGAVVKITSAPNSADIGKTGVYMPDGSWLFSNLALGTYKVTYDSGCTGETPKTFTFSITDSYNVLKQNMTSVGTSNCSGTGFITSVVDTNTQYSYVVELLDSTGAVIATNSTGNFNNLKAGTYTTRLKINGCTSSYYPSESVNTITLTDSTTGPKITNYQSIICTDSGGNPLTTGCIYLDLAGSGKLKLEYSTDNTTWTLVSADSPRNNSICGLTANKTYYVRLTDDCSSYNTQITVGTLSSISMDTASQPCYGSNYLLSTKYYSGATYQIISPSGAVLSNTRAYTIPNYSTASDGLYTIKISWGTCYTKLLYVYLNGGNCGQPIGNTCFKNPGTINPALPTNHGITALGRAGAQADNWPMVRTGAHTALEAQTKGFVINRMPAATSGNIGEPLDATGTPAIATPAVGMMFYDTTNNCLKINTDGLRTGWKCYNNTGCPNY